MPPSPSPEGEGDRGGEASRPHRVHGAASRDKVWFAREQRRQPTRAEELLWRALRARGLGARFRRQHPVGDFVLDFYCEAAALAVEVDGPHHADQAGYDEWRAECLDRYGIHALRVTTQEVQMRLLEVLERIGRCLTP